MKTTPNFVACRASYLFANFTERAKTMKTEVLLALGFLSACAFFALADITAFILARVRS